MNPIDRLQAPAQQPMMASPARLTVAANGARDPNWTVGGAGGRGLFVHYLRPPAPLHAAGTLLQLCWHDGVGNELLAVSARVRDSDASGMRLQLDSADEAAVSRIQALSQQPPAPAKSSTAASIAASDSRERQLTLIAESIRSSLSGRCDQLLARALSGLEDVANDKTAEVANMPARMVQTRLLGARQSLVEHFRERMLQPWTAHSEQRRGESFDFGSMQLIDDQDMQIWLTRRESARIVETQVRGSWLRLRPTLQLAAESRAGTDADTLGVDAIFDALVHTFKAAALEAPLQHFLLRLAEQPSVLNLGSYYDELQIGLQRISPRAAPPAVASPAAAGTTTATATAERHAPEPVTGASGTTASAPRTREAEVANPGNAKFASPPVFASKPAGAVPANAGQALSAARRIWSYARPPAAAQVTAYERAPTLSDSDLLGAMRELVNAPSVRHANAEQFREGLQKRAAAMTGNAQARPDPRQREAIDLMARLQQAFDLDPLLPASFSGWSRPLLAPILATQLQPNGLDEASEPLRQLFSLIEFGSVLCSERQDAQTREIRAGMDRILGDLARSPTLVPGQLKGACEQLEQLLQRHRKAGSAIEERVVEACLGQQRLVEARQLVNKELAVLFGGRDIPKALADLIEQRLATRMVLTVLRMSAGGTEWPRLVGHLEHLDNALRLAADGQPAIDAEHYVSWIRSLFPADVLDPALLNPQLSEIKQALVGQPVAWIRYQTAMADAAQDPIHPTSSDASADQLQRLALLQPGDWLAFGAAGVEPRLLKLAWRAPDHSRFVFVTKLGHKADDLTRAQLESAFADHSARIVDEGNASIIERAWRRMLGDMHDELAEQATHDPLTGLLNRKELDRRLVAWIGARERTPTVLLWIGVDHLRVINQTHGMGAGDQVLREFGLTLQRHIGATEPAIGYAARMAGDEFVLVFEGVAPVEAERRASALLDQLNALELNWEGSHFRISASMGLLIADDSCTSAERLFADAERACRAAKESGRGRIYRHENDDSRLSQMRETVSWVGRVEQSLQTHALLLYGQRARSLSPRARQDPDYVEVLLRMRTETGIAAPGDFIVAAERYGQIKAVDRFVLQDLTRMLQKPRSAQAFRIAFNVSARNIIDKEFIEEIIETLQQQPLPMSQLCVELTETAAIQQLAEATVGMQRLTDSGLCMVLDDFGSGWSSYQYLRRLPFGIVKVDGAFIRDIAKSAEDLALARSINEIAHLLGKRTVAEHVEDQETLDHVREIGFDYAQGYFVGHPTPLAELIGAAE